MVTKKKVLVCHPKKGLVLVLAQVKICGQVG